MRFRNDEHPRHIPDLGIGVGHCEEYEWPGWDRKVHGHPPTGSILLDPEPADEEDDAATADEDSKPKTPRLPRVPATPATASSTPASPADTPANQEPPQ